MSVPAAPRKPDGSTTPPSSRFGCDWAGVVCETLRNPWIWTVALGIVLIATR